MNSQIFQLDTIKIICCLLSDIEITNFLSVCKKLNSFLLGSHIYFVQKHKLTSKICSSKYYHSFVNLFIDKINHLTNIPSVKNEFDSKSGAEMDIDCRSIPSLPVNLIKLTIDNTIFYDGSKVIRLNFTLTLANNLSIEFFLNKCVKLTHLTLDFTNNFIKLDMPPSVSHLNLKNYSSFLLYDQIPQSITHLKIQCYARKDYIPMSVTHLEINKFYCDYNSTKNYNHPNITHLILNKTNNKISFLSYYDLMTIPESIIYISADESYRDFFSGGIIENVTITYFTKKATKI